MFNLILFHPISSISTLFNLQTPKGATISLFFHALHRKKKKKKNEDAAVAIFFFSANLSLLRDGFVAVNVTVTVDVDVNVDVNVVGY